MARSGKAFAKPYMRPNSELVLVVDDEPLDVDFIQRTLESAGFRVITANNPTSARQRFLEHAGEIDLLVIDVSLPGKNGVEVANELLRLKPDVRVLFNSGHVGAEVIRFYGLPATDRHFLTKPFEAQTLIDRVLEILENPEPLTFPKSSYENGDTETQRK